MVLEYCDCTIDEGQSAPETLNAKAAEGWRVHTAYSPTHFLLERGETSIQPPPRAMPTPPTGAPRG